MSSIWFSFHQLSAARFLHVAKESAEKKSSALQNFEFLSLLCLERAEAAAFRDDGNETSNGSVESAFGKWRDHHLLLLLPDSHVSLTRRSWASER